MKDEQFIQLITAMKPKEPVEVKHDLVDNLSKIGVALCVGGIMWVGGQIQAQDRKLIEIGANQAHIARKIQTFEAFTEKPRFTKEDFITEMRLYEKRLDLIEGELKVRSNFMSETNRRLEGYE